MIGGTSLHGAVTPTVHCFLQSVDCYSSTSRQPPSLWNPSTEGCVLEKPKLKTSSCNALERVFSSCRAVVLSSK